MSKLDGHSGRLNRAFADCRDWSSERIARWLQSPSIENDAETSFAYSLCLARQQVARHEPTQLRESLKRIQNTWSQLSFETQEHALLLFRDVLKELIERADYAIADESMDLLIQTALLIVDSIGSLTSPVIVLLHTIGNFYQSQCRNAELEAIRRRELQLLRPLHDAEKDKRTLFDSWQESIERGNLDDARQHFADICKQLIDIEDLGLLALSELIPDLVAMSFKANKPKEVDVVLDVVLIEIASERAGSEHIVMLLHGLATLLTQNQWFHEALIFVKRVLEIQIQNNPSSPRLSDLFKELTVLSSNCGQAEQTGAFCEHLLDSFSKIDVQPNLQFKQLLQEQCDLLSKTKKQSSGFKERLNQARMHKVNPEVFVRELSATLVNFVSTVNIAVLRPAILELLEAYDQCPVRDTNSSQAVWQFVQQFCSHFPDEVMPFLQPLSDSAVKRIQNGEPLMRFDHYFVNMKISTNNAEFKQAIDEAFERILISSTSGAGATPENRLTAALARTQKISELPADERIQFSERILREAVQASVDQEGDGCLAIPAILNLTRHFSNSGEDRQTIATINAALTQYSNCVNLRHSDAGAEQLWRAAESEVRRGRILESVVDPVLVSLLRLTEKRTLSPHAVNSVDRDMVAICCELARRSKFEEAERLLLDALKLRETVQGADSKNLLPFLVCHLSLCEQLRKFEQCKEIQDRIMHVNALSFGARSDMVILRRVENASFYLRINDLKQADSEWRQALHEFRSRSIQPLGLDDANTDIPMPPVIMQALCRLAEQYVNKTLLNNAESIVSEILPNWPPSGSENLEQLLNFLIVKCTQEERYSAAEALLTRAIGAACVPVVTRNLLRGQLSDHYLATRQPEESKRVFDQVIQSLIANNIDTKSWLRNRSKSLKQRGFRLEAEAIDACLPQSTKPPSFAFAIFAVQEINLSGNVEVTSYKSSLTAPNRGIRSNSNSAHIGSFGSIKLSGNARIQGFVVEPSAPNGPEQIRFGPRSAGGGTPLGRNVNRFSRMHPSSTPSLPAPNLDTYEVAPVLAVPLSPAHNADGTIPTSTAKRLESGYITGLAAGDYVLYNPTKLGQSNGRDDGRIRLFILDTDAAASSAVHIRQLESKKPIDLQIWYDGTRDIVFEHAHRLVACIYAPNATVKLSGNTVFAGAILANRIIADGNVQILFDEDLAGVLLG